MSGERGGEGGDRERRGEGDVIIEGRGGRGRCMGEGGGMEGEGERRYNRIKTLTSA